MQNSQSVDGSDLHWQMVRRSYVTDGTKTNHIDWYDPPQGENGTHDNQLMHDKISLTFYYDEIKHFMVCYIYIFNCNAAVT